MREIFAVDKPSDPGRVYYTIRREDVGESILNTEIGPILLVNVIGKITQADVGRRLLRVPDESGLIWHWEIEAEVYDCGHYR